MFANSDWRGAANQRKLYKTRVTSPPRYNFENLGLFFVLISFEFSIGFIGFLIDFKEVIRFLMVVVSVWLVLG